MDFASLNRMIHYIEDNLTNEIDFNALSKIAHANLFILERIFMFLTGMTITEYIKKRRLSRAFEDIRNTDLKIIDIAFKYQYNSASSFNRAFKQLFSITPTECRRGIGNYKLIPIEYFETKQKNYNFDYEIRKVSLPILYCYHITSNHFSDFSYKIRQLYRNVKNNGYYKKFNEMGMYGIFFEKEGLYHYLLGSKQYFSNLEKIEIPENEYAEFRPISREQKDIVALEEKINKQWIPSTNYAIKNNLKIEFYHNDCCSVYLLLK